MFEFKKLNVETNIEKKVVISYYLNNLKPVCFKKNSCHQAEPELVLEIELLLVFFSIFRNLQFSG